jgi:S1-C subfamily serine protease
MNNVSRLTIGFVSSVILYFYCQGAIAQNQCTTNNELQEIAKNITVKFRWSEALTATDNAIFGGGSGVIIKMITQANQNVYYVITNHHVVQDDTYVYWILPDGDRIDQPDRYSADIIDSKSRPDDVALVSFQLESIQDPDYQTAVLGYSENLPNSTCAYVAGFPAAPNSAEEWKVVAVQIIAENLQNLTNDPGPFSYSPLSYAPINPERNAEKGMSGGSILNSFGQLIGIHTGEIPPDLGYQSNRFGIPIEFIQGKFPDVFADLPKEPQPPSLPISPRGANPPGAGVFSPPPSPTQPEPPSVIEPSPDNRPEEDLKKPTPGQW